jgi:hypothetical protein
MADQARYSKSGGRHDGLPAPLWIGSASLLTLALFQLPLGYYTFLRLTVCAAAGYSAWFYLRHSKDSWLGWLFAAISLAYNPILPVHLERAVWCIVDVGTLIVFCSQWAFPRISPLFLKHKAVSAVLVIILVLVVAEVGIKKVQDRERDNIESAHNLAALEKSLDKAYEETMGSSDRGASSSSSPMIATPQPPTSSFNVNDEGAQAAIQGTSNEHGNRLGSDVPPAALNAAPLNEPSPATAADEPSPATAADEPAKSAQ